MTAKPASASRTTFSRTMLPSDANPFGNVHGGEIVKLIDECAGAAAARHARSRVVTARIDELSFTAPVYVGDLVTARASVNDVGRTSMEVGVRVEAENTLTGKIVHIASAYLVFDAIGEDGRPASIPPVAAETDDDRRGPGRRTRLRRPARHAGRNDGRLSDMVPGRHGRAVGVGHRDIPLMRRRHRAGSRVSFGRGAYYVERPALRRSRIGPKSTRVPQ